MTNGLFRKVVGEEVDERGVMRDVLTCGHSLTQELPRRGVPKQRRCNECFKSAGLARKGGGVPIPLD